MILKELHHLVLLVKSSVFSSFAMDSATMKVQTPSGLSITHDIQEQTGTW